MALNWFKAHSDQKRLEITSQNSPKFTTALEMAVRFGKILIVEEVESVLPSLLPILRKDFIYQGIIFMSNFHNGNYFYKM